MIEENLIEHLRASEELTRHMAKYADIPAIFSQEAPADTDGAWDNQYPRVVFAIDTQGDVERGVAGTLLMDVMTEKEGELAPEDIEPIVRNLIDGYFFSNPQITIAAQWDTSRYFTEPTEKVIGVTMNFRLLEFPPQTTCDPDPIALLNEWTANELPKIIGIESVRVIGRDSLPSAWKPTDEQPAVFWRLGNISSSSLIPDTYSCIWQTAHVYGHIMAKTSATETIIERTINSSLAHAKRLIFEDLAPLMLDAIRHNPTNDPLRNGQIELDSTYGILNPQLNQGQRLGEILIK